MIAVISYFELNTQSYNYSATHNMIEFIKQTLYSTALTQRLCFRLKPLKCNNLIFTNI